MLWQQNRKASNLETDNLANAINFFKIPDLMFCPLPHQKKSLQIFLGDGKIDKAALWFHPNKKVVQNSLPKCNFATVRMFVTSVCSILLKPHANHIFWKGSHLFPSTSQENWYLDMTIKLNFDSTNTYCSTLIIIAITLPLNCEVTEDNRRHNSIIFPETNTSQKILELPSCNTGLGQNHPVVSHRVQNISKHLPIFFLPFAML